MRGILAGDRAGLTALAERLACVPRFLQLLERRRGRSLGREELADLAQDVLVLVWRKLPEYEGLASLESWALGMCVLEYQNAVRRRERRRHEARVLALHASRTSGVAADRDPWAFEEVHAGLLRIGREEALVIRLKHFEGWTFDEIGHRLELSPNTIKARYYRGLEELRPLLASGDTRAEHGS